MAGLMVYHEGSFDDARIVAVEDCEDGVLIRVTATADTAQWFDADSPHADADGWVRGGKNFVAEVELGFQDPSVRADKLAILRRWRDEGELVRGMVLFEHQAVGFINPKTREVVAVKMSQEQLDQA